MSTRIIYDDGKVKEKAELEETVLGLKKGDIISFSYQVYDSHVHNLPREGLYEITRREISSNLGISVSGDRRFRLEATYEARFIE